MSELSELKERRAALLNAISKIENGAQEYRLGSRSLKRADLGTLYAQYEQLTGRISQIERPTCTVAVLGRRRGG